MSRPHYPLALLLLALSLPATAGKNCDELKSEIEAKINAKGVPAFSLDVLAADAAVEGKVVGRCEGGSKQIVYQRGAKAAAAAPATPAEPAAATPPAQ